MLSHIHSAALCGIDYIFYPITPYRKLIFQHVLARVEGGDVLDLGCGQAGLYWALGYARRCRSICFLDYHAENVTEINNQLAQLSPEFIEDHFSDTTNFLRETNLHPSGYTDEQVAFDIMDKIDSVRQNDFRLPFTTQKFDTIVAIESLECVSSIEELLSVTKVCYGALKPGGTLVGIAAHYDRFTDRTQELIDIHFAGALNPHSALLSRALKESGFDSACVESMPTPELHNYSESFVFHATKR